MRPFRRNSCFLEYLCLGVLFALTLAPRTTHAVLSQWKPTTNRIKRRRVIVGGRVADLGRYPYFVRLDYDGYAGCGGSLVDADLVLTAAHCVFDEDVDISSITAVRGTASDTEERTISRIFPHPAYDDPTNRYDVAVVQLDRPFKHVSLVQLATTNHSEWGLKQQPYANVTVIGWGVTAEDGDVSDVLREAHLRVVPDDECQESYGDGSIHAPSMMCAVAETNQGPCYRDSGGPLLLLGDVDDHGSDLQVGIVSFGGDYCADPAVPSVYVDVANIQPWVKRVSLVDFNDGPIVIVDDHTKMDDMVTDDTVSPSACKRLRKQRWVLVALALLSVLW